MIQYGVFEITFSSSSNYIWNESFPLLFVGSLIRLASLIHSPSLSAHMNVIACHINNSKNWQGKFLRTSTVRHSSAAQLSTAPDRLAEMWLARVLHLQRSVRCERIVDCMNWKMCTDDQVYQACWILNSRLVLQIVGLLVGLR